MNAHTSKNLVLLRGEERINTDTEPLNQQISVMKSGNLFILFAWVQKVDDETEVAVFYWHGFNLQQYKKNRTRRSCSPSNKKKNHKIMLSIHLYFLSLLPFLLRRPQNIAAA
ncbi:hypothetical protein AMTRI_Chr07g79100 [Amborella trichopoda]